MQIGDRLPARRSVAPIPTPAADAPSTADLLVVGAGVMGAWTAYWARAGAPGRTGTGAAAGP